MASKEEVLLKIRVIPDELIKAQEEVKRLNKEIKDLSKSEGDNTAAILQLNKELIVQKDSVKDLTAITKAKIQIDKNEAESVGALRGQLALNTIEINKMSEAERTTTEKGKQLVASTRDISEKLKTMEGAVGDTRRQVGNYAEQIDKSATGQSILASKAAEAAGGFNVFGHSINSTKEMVGGLWKTMLANPFTLILAAVSGLIAMLMQFDAPAKAFKTIMLEVKAVGQTFFDLLKPLAEWLGKLFKDPMGAMKDFAKAIQENIINRFTALGGLMRGIGEILTGEFKKGITTITDSFFQMGTGVKDISSKMAQFTKDLNANRKEAYELELMQKKLKASTREWLIQEKQLEIERQRYKLQSTDIIRKQGETFEDVQKRTEAAADKSLSVDKKIVDGKMFLANLSLQIANKELEIATRHGRGIIEAKQTVADATVALKQIELDELNFREKLQIRQARTQDRLDKKSEAEAGKHAKLLEEITKQSEEKDKLEAIKNGLILQLEYYGYYYDELEKETQAGLEAILLLYKEDGADKKAIVKTIGDDLLGITEDNNSKIIAAEAKAGTAKFEEWKKEYEWKKEFNKQTKLDTLDSAQSLSNDLFEIRKIRANAEMELELKAAGDDEAKKNEIRKKQMKKDRDWAIFQIAMNTGVGVAKAFATTSTWQEGLAASIALSIAGNAQAVMVNEKYKASIKTMAKGGMIDGASHSGGGVMVNAEGGEFVVNKNTMAANSKVTASGTPSQIISQLNELGNARKFQFGGFVSGTPINSTRNSDIMMADFSTAIDNKINQIQVIQDLRGLETAQNKLSVTQKIGTF